MDKRALTFSLFAILMILTLSAFVIADNHTNGTNITGNSTGNFTIEDTNETITPPVNETNITETSATIDNETKIEVDVMQRNSFGTEMMLYQLKRNIGIKIFQANAVIDYVQEKGNDTTNLEAIVVLLEDLNLSVDNIDTTNRTEAVKEFIDIKLQAKDLVEQFRNESHIYLNDNDRRSLRAQFISIERDRLNTLRERIRNSEKEFLKEQAGKVLDIIGRNRERLMERISNNSNFTAHQVRLEIRNEYNNLSEGEREEARLRLREDAIEGKRQRAVALEEAKKNRDQRLLDITNRRMEILRQRGLENASVGSSNFSNWMMGQGR